MIERIKLKDRITSGGNYHASPKSEIEFISSGSTTLDLVLGGGWAENRIANIVGDKSSGKTLLCIEAIANFAIKYPKGMIRYREAEAAFQLGYAEALGMPINRVDFGESHLETVEDLFEDLDYCAANAKEPELYICDSLDALSDRAELGRDMNAGTFGAEKAKKMSQLFRRLIRRLEEARITVIIVSQVRSKIGIAFGRTTTRTGGRALDFYASQVLYLAQAATITKTVSNIKRPVGVVVKAKMDKNKISLPFRETQFDILFGYGLNDIGACLDWLKQIGRLGDLGLSEKTMKGYEKELMSNPVQQELQRLHDTTSKSWYEIEMKFLPVVKKYA